jgi:endoglucanase
MEKRICVSILLNLLFAAYASAAPVPAATLVAPAPAMPGKNVPAIKVNTLGYPWNWEKMAVFNVKPEKGKAVVKHADGKTALVLGEASAIRDMGKDEASKDPVWQVSFPILTTPGKYYIESKGVKSDLFQIGGVDEQLYAPVLKAALKHFYFQRCRCALTETYAAWEGSLYTRATACHAHEGIAWDYAHYPQKKKRWKPDAGWHDAGNYEMYVPSTAPTCQALLTAFERHPGLFKDGQLNLPESGNKVPDILDEAAWGLRWILSLQQEDGGVRHREAVFDWSQEGPADKEMKDHWIAGVGTASTGKACAVFAQAARVYAPHDKAFADKCRKAALKSWKFLKAHPERITVDGKGSGQPLWDDGAEYKKETGSRLAAAVEMWRTFQDKDALAEARQWLRDPDSQLTESMGSWVNLSRVGLYGLSRKGSRRRTVTAAPPLPRIIIGGTIPT